MSNAPRFYTLGYLGRTVPEVVAILDERNALLADIRLAPYARNPSFIRGALERALGARYVWIQALGNLNYKTGGPIQLADYEAGKAALLALNGPAVLMCACRDHATCHRTVVAGLLADEGYRVEEIPLGRAQ